MNDKNKSSSPLSFYSPRKSQRNSVSGMKTKYIFLKEVEENTERWDRKEWSEKWEALGCEDGMQKTEPSKLSGS